jgi:hypothetical protein
MSQAIRALNETDLELALLRRSVDRQASQRSTCVDCGRTPLIGERVFRFPHAPVVCELCRTRRAAEPESSSIVRHGIGGTVRLLLKRAA